MAGPNNHPENRVLRFAPSPTGLLHLGNARIALLNWLAAQPGGRLILRFDDTDIERSREEYVAAIRRDLSWLGIGWDEEARQSTRLARYQQAGEALRESGRLYPCYETTAELALKRRSALAAGRPPIYDRAGLALDEAARARLEAEGRRPHWRFRLHEGAITWHDTIRGEVRFDAAKLSDPVLIREDGAPLYHLPSMVDDIDFGITDIVRGEDHVDNTALHVQLFAALLQAEGNRGVPLPRFAHAPIMLDRSGRRLSKRVDSFSLVDLRDREGIEPLAIAVYLAGLGGTTDGGTEFPDRLDGLARRFDLAGLSRSAVRYDPDALSALHVRLLHRMDFALVRDRLEALGCRGVDEAFWITVRPNLTRFAEAAEWWRLCGEDVELGDAVSQLSEDDRRFLVVAADVLERQDWDEVIWRRWTVELRAETGRAGRALFLPLRLALTGRGDGPEMAKLLLLLGQGRALVRLRAGSDKRQ